ncbi:Aspercryptin biosynthesis cluster-specific transcription regulator atnN [Hyphodiscus hymeniophilus]|uniref:Aspercryptin biosynthesis cluster-specific transcription regulator atnN n=1 Tax=Hyphodiscus hymeniophilus TaxID=353542 RepID=A0A9P6VMV4_9HELO|nr:Aspercryptin biosynthesis cluster-specific transcription regulator atnN [Hyphodiscus hymeniophilus]
MSQLTERRMAAINGRIGCVTYKIRRVKCGEAKPSCLRCTSTGRKCDGYVSPPARQNSKSTPRKTPAPKSASTQSANGTPASAIAISRSPSTDISGIPSQRRSFHYFRMRNMSLMPGNFEPYFWDHLVLQYSHRDPTIRYSLIALSTIYEEREGLVKAAIMEDLRKRDQEGARVGSDESDVEDIYGSLSRSFKRLSTQAMIHGRVSSCPEPGLSTHPWKTENSTPIEFGNLFEARNSLDGMLNSTAVCLRQIRDLCKFGTAEQVLDLLLIDSALEGFFDELDEWQRATQKLLIEFPDLGKQTHAVAHLDLYHTYLTIILRTPFAMSEMVFDGYTTEFARIVDLAGRLLQPLADDDPPVLSFDLGVMQPLFLTALKCRDIHLRRQALALLKSAPEQEGLWYRTAVVAHAKWKINFEERGRGELPESSPLPEIARIYQESLSFEIRDGVSANAIVQEEWGESY